MVVETAAVVQRRFGIEAVRDFLSVFVPVLTVELVDLELHAAAVTGLLAAGRRDVSLVDWVSFELMRREGIETAFAFDRDFGAQGFETVP